MNRLPRCDTTGLQRVWCLCPEHFDGFTMTPEEQQLMSYRFADVDVIARPLRRLERFSVRLETGLRRGRQWREPTPRRNLCDDSHTKPPGALLCHDCRDALERHLGDIPALVHDLEVAYRKDVHFIPHRVVADADESPLTFNEAAGRCLNSLGKLFADNPIRGSRHWLRRLHTITARQADELAQLTARAHRIIERPPDALYVGTCPLCNQPLTAERGQPVHCQACGRYQEEWDAHMANTIADHLDTLLTVSELVAALNVPRDEVKNLIRRMDGHKLVRAHLNGHLIATTAVTCYRIGDVLTEQARRAETRARRNAGRNVQPVLNLSPDMGAGASLGVGPCGAR